MKSINQVCITKMPHSHPYVNGIFTFKELSMLQSCFLDNGDFNNEEFNKLVQRHRGQIIGNIQKKLF
ncbi:MAG: hypothetical protein H6Q68_2901 [Firmicutes bacterium]|nr:hypothetical protein [Bacillota bacterium]